MRKVLFVICALLFAWMIWRCGISLLWENLLAWNWTLLLCILVWAIGYVLNTFSFAQVLKCYQQGVNKPAWRRFGRVSVLTVGGYALNYLTPFGLLGGEPWRIHQLRKDLDPLSANSAVAYYAVMHITSHIAFWIIGAFYAVFAMPEMMQEYMWQFGLIIVGILAALVIVYMVGVRKGWIGDLRSLMQHHPKELGEAFFLELLSRMVNVVEYWLLLEIAMPDSLLSGYWAAYLVVAFSSLFANVLFFCPLQMGTREGGILLILAALLPMQETDLLFPLAVSISFATRIREFFWIAVGMLMMRFGVSSKVSE